jgi:hypothetical protein
MCGEEAMDRRVSAQCCCCCCWTNLDGGSWRKPLLLFPRDGTMVERDAERCMGILRIVNVVVALLAVENMAFWILMMMMMLLSSSSLLLRSFVVAVHSKRSFLKRFPTDVRFFFVDGCW